MIIDMKYIVLMCSFIPLLVMSEVNSWECNKFEDAKIVAEDGTELGELGPKWKTKTIYLKKF